MPKQKKPMTKADKKAKFKTVKRWLDWKRKKKAEALNREFWSYGVIAS